MFGIEHVSASFGSVQALSDVSLSIPAGEVTAVIGGDGAGKTTLLRVLVGVVHPSKGKVDAPPKAQLGYLPAQAGSWRALSVAENVSFVGGSYGLTGDELAARADPLLDRAGLAHVRDRLAGHLSGGMRTKLGFCLAMLHSPSLVVLDEPTTGIDPSSRVDLWRMISQAVSGGAAVVMSTSYMDDAERASSVLLLERGSMIATGSPDDLVRRMPGVVVECERPVHRDRAWRVGAEYREWWPDGAPNGIDPIQPNLEDASIVAALRHRAGARP